MSENLDHESGGTFATEDKCNAKCLNVKEVIVQSANPTNPYDGTFFVDTDDDPPIVRIYDDTNTAYMTKHAIWYSTGAKRYKTVDILDGRTVRNGVLSIQHDTTESDDFLYFMANSVWYGMKQV